MLQKNESGTKVMLKHLHQGF